MRPTCTPAVLEGKAQEAWLGGRSPPGAAVGRLSSLLAPWAVPQPSLHPPWTKAALLVSMVTARADGDGCSPLPVALGLCLWGPGEGEEGWGRVSRFPSPKAHGSDELIL